MDIQIVEFWEFTKNTSSFQAFKAAEEEVQARWKYEDNIKRPYFHMKPLERGQVRWCRLCRYIAHSQGLTCIYLDNINENKGKMINELIITAR